MVNEKIECGDVIVYSGNTETLYQYHGFAKPAGVMKGSELLHVYSDLKTGQIYYRSNSDFNKKMQLHCKKNSANASMLNLTNEQYIVLSEYMRHHMLSCIIVALTMLRRNTPHSLTLASSILTAACMTDDVENLVQQCVSDEASDSDLCYQMCDILMPNALPVEKRSLAILCAIEEGIK